MTEKKESQARIRPTPDEDVAALKRAFNGRDDLLNAVRSVVFGFTVNPELRSEVYSTFRDFGVREAFRRKLVPSMSPSDAIGEMSDYWAGIENQLLGQSTEHIRQAVEYRRTAMGMFEAAFRLLVYPDAPNVDLAAFPSVESDPYQVWLIARNAFIKSVETTFSFVKAIAAVKDETPERARRRLQGESSK